VTADGLGRRHRRAPSRRALVASVLVVIAILALAFYYGWGGMEQNEFSAYQNTPNTSPPVNAQAGGVILSVAHSHYLILDTIAVTLTNDSGAPIYLPKLPMSDCWESQAEYQSAQGWQPNGAVCSGYSAVCAGGAAPALLLPTVDAVAPGASIILDSVDGNTIYPLLQAGAYRFSVTYSLTPTKNPQISQWASSTSVTLTAAPVTLSSAWWIPPWKNASESPLLRCGLGPRA
jgi:hypothetical protein